MILAEYTLPNGEKIKVADNYYSEKDRKDFITSLKSILTTGISYSGTCNTYNNCSLCPLYARYCKTGNNDLSDEITQNYKPIKEHLIKQIEENYIEYLI